ncbi:hypothetical protein EE612_021210 [Oryza sativa]|nr:hypothetical protein EE612_021210 [Oryza sativa]
MSRTTPSSPLSRATPPRSPTAGGTPSRLAVAPPSPTTPQCAIPASPHTPGRGRARRRPRRAPRPEITLRQPSSQAQQKQKRAVRRGAEAVAALRAIRALLRSLSWRPPRAARRPRSAAAQQAARRAAAGARDGDVLRPPARAHHPRRPGAARQPPVPRARARRADGEADAGDLHRRHVRVALECEKRPKKLPAPPEQASVSLLEEAMWTAYVNGRRVGYAVRREASEGDLADAAAEHGVGRRRRAARGRASRPGRRETAR